MSEIATRNPAQELVARVRTPEFKEQIKLALPDNMSADRFVRVTVTALMQNPGIAKAEPTSLLQAIIRSAQDGLVPDGREAALVMFGDKATYMPMIGGFRKIAAEYGWLIRTHVVYANDEYDYELGMEEKLIHRPPKPGVDRGELVAAYAVCVHRDGRKFFEPMSAEDIAKCRKASKTASKGPWVDWEERMWEKSVGRRAFAKLSLDPNDVRIARMIEEVDLEPGEAATMLYGPGAGVSDAADSIGRGTADDLPPGEDDEPGITEPVEEATVVEAGDAKLKELADAAGMVIPQSGKFGPDGEHGPKSLAEIHALGDDGAKWFKFQIDRADPASELGRAVWEFARVYLPEIHDAATSREAAQS